MQRNRKFREGLKRYKSKKNPCLAERLLKIQNQIDMYRYKIRCEIQKNTTY